MAKARAWVMIPRLDKDRTGCVIDMRPLVLCKDCKSLSSPPGSIMFCGHIRKFVDADWFCADGERKSIDG